MVRHKLTREEQLRGVKKALASRKTPKWFKSGLQKRLKQLKK